MKRLTTFLMALMLITLGASAQSSWTAPVLQSSTLSTEGGKYYLFNTEAKQYACEGSYKWGTNAIFGDNGLLFTLASASTTDYDGTAVTAYTLTSSAGQFFWDGEYIYCDGSNKTTGIYFVFTETEEGSKVYKIHGTYADIDTYIGYDPEEDSKNGYSTHAVLPALEGTEGQGIEWKLYAEDAEELYDALVILYNTLVHAESYGMTNDEAYTAAGAVYTSGTATVDDVMAAVAALEIAMEAYASEDDPDDVTYAYITNPDFDSYSDSDGFIGWTNSGMTYQGTPHTNGDITISVFPEKWVESTSSLSDAKISQLLADLPKGTYRLEADAIAVKQNTQTETTVTGVYLYAKSPFTSTTSVSTTDGLPAHYTVDFEVAEDGTSVDIGFEVSSTNANWVAVDNFRLYYLSSEVTTVLTDTKSDYSNGDVATIYGHKYDVKSNNMVENHSFELGLTGWTDATPNHNTLTSEKFELRSDEAQDGNVYLVGTTNEGVGSDTDDTGGGSLCTGWTIEAGKTYYFSYYVKGLGTATDGGYLRTDVVNELGGESGGVVFSTPTVTTEWQKIEYLFTNTEYKLLQVEFRWLNTQWGFDNFQLYQVELAEDVLEGVSDDSEYKTGDVVNADGYACTITSNNMFVNGGFNADMYGWTAGGYFVTANPDDFDVEEEGGFNDGAYLVASSGSTSSEKTPSQAIAVEEGKTYLFIGYTSGKTPDSQNLEYNALFKMSDAVTEASGEKIIVQLEWGADPTETADEWTKTMAVFTVPEENEDDTFPYVGMRMGWSSGSYDGFQLYEVEAVELDYTNDVTWKLANPSFEVDNVAYLTEDATRSYTEDGNENSYTGGAYTIGNGLTGWTLSGNNSVSDLMTEACKRTDNNFGAPGTPTDGTQMLYLRNNATTTGSVKQTITLPAGEYMLTVDSKCVSSSSSSAKLVAGGKSTSLDIHSSYVNGDEELKWDTAELKFSLDAETEVTVGVDISYSGNGSFLLDNFKLYTAIEENEYEDKFKETINWEMTDAMWGTMILPFAATLPEGLTAYSCNGTEDATDEDGNTITEVALTEIEGQSIEANTPYVIKCTDESAIKTHTFSGVPSPAEDGTYKETYTEGLLTGTLVDLAVEKGAAFTLDGTEYLLQNHTGEGYTEDSEEGYGIGFYPIWEDSSAGATLEAYHCYLTYTTSGSQNPVRAFISLPGDAGEETGIVTVEGTEVASDAIYDLAGRRVSKAVKGVYIQNGKKVLVK